MGGITNASFIFPQEVEFMNSIFPKVSVKLKDGCVWREIKASRYGISTRVDPQQTDAGTLYNISGDIQVPKQNMNSSGMTFCNQLTLLGGIMKYTTGNGDVFVLGSVVYPLHLFFEIITPNSPTGFSGYKLTFSGKQLTPQLLLQ